jgi:hypothetical protein
LHHVPLISKLIGGKLLGLTLCLHYHKYVLQNNKAIEEAVEHENKGKPAIASKYCMEIIKMHH